MRGSARLGVARFGEVRQGKVWHGEVRQVRCGQARFGRVRLGALRHGTAWFGSAGMVGQGKAGRGMVRQVRQGLARQGMARHGRAWLGRYGLGGNVMEKFSWKAGTQYPVKAEVAANTIRDLQETLGKDSITAKELLDASRDEAAPLHSCFEWEDTVAAEQYRIYQARHLIGSIEIEYVKDNTPTQLARSRYFINVVKIAPKVQGQFATIDVALTNDEYRVTVLKNALRELRAFQNKYSSYQELASVFKSIDDFADTIK